MVPCVTCNFPKSKPYYPAVCQCVCPLLYIFCRHFLTTLHRELLGLCSSLQKEITRLRETEMVGSVYFRVYAAVFKKTELKRPNGPEFLSHAYITLLVVQPHCLRNATYFKFSQQSRISPTCEYQVQNKELVRYSLIALRVTVHFSIQSQLSKPTKYTVLGRNP